MLCICPFSQLAGQGDWNRGIKKYTAARKHLPHQPELDFYLGAAYSKIGQSDQAIKTLHRSQRGFSDKNQYIVLAKAHIDKGEYALAEASLNQVLGYYPGLLTPHFWLSRICFETGALAGAKRELEIIIASDNHPNSGEIEQVKRDAIRALEALNARELEGLNHY